MARLRSADACRSPDRRDTKKKSHFVGANNKPLEVFPQALVSTHRELRGSRKKALISLAERYTKPPRSCPDVLDLVANF